MKLTPAWPVLWSAGTVRCTHLWPLISLATAKLEKASCPSNRSTIVGFTRSCALSNRAVWGGRVWAGIHDGNSYGSCVETKICNAL